MAGTPNEQRSALIRHLLKATAPAPAPIDTLLECYEASDSRVRAALSARHLDESGTVADRRDTLARALSAGKPRPKPAAPAAANVTLDTIDSAAHEHVVAGPQKRGVDVSGSKAAVKLRLAGKLHEERAVRRATAPVSSRAECTTASYARIVLTLKANSLPTRGSEDKLRKRLRDHLPKAAELATDADRDGDMSGGGIDEATLARMIQTGVDIEMQRRGLGSGSGSGAGAGSGAGSGVSADDLAAGRKAEQERVRRRAEIKARAERALLDLDTFDLSGDDHTTTTTTRYARSGTNSEGKTSDVRTHARDTGGSVPINNGQSAEGDGVDWKHLPMFDNLNRSTFSPSAVHVRDGVLVFSGRRTGITSYAELELLHEMYMPRAPEDLQSFFKSGRQLMAENGGKWSPFLTEWATEAVLQLRAGTVYEGDRLWDRKFTAPARMRVQIKAAHALQQGEAKRKSKGLSRPCRHCHGSHKDAECRQASRRGTSGRRRNSSRGGGGRGGNGGKRYRDDDDDRDHRRSDYDDRYIRRSGGSGQPRGRGSGRDRHDAKDKKM